MEYTALEQSTLSLFNQYDLVTYLFSQLHNRRFIAMEMALLSLIEESVDGKHKVVKWMYLDFNKMYFAWLQSRKYNLDKEKDDLRSLEHDNYLLAYCQGVQEMEEILIEANEYIEEKSTPHQKSLVLLLVRNYRHRYI